MFLAKSKVSHAMQVLTLCVPTLPHRWSTTTSPSAAEATWRQDALPARSPHDGPRPTQPTRDIARPQPERPQGRPCTHHAAVSSSSPSPRQAASTSAEAQSPQPQEPVSRTPKQQGHGTRDVETWKSKDGVDPQTYVSYRPWWQQPPSPPQDKNE